MLKGFITNLRAYNEGRLQGKWIDFPIMEDELEDVLEEIGINGDYEEYFITDWETDWEIEPQKEFGEYPNIDYINEIAEELECIENYNELDWLYAYIECTEASLYDAVMQYQDNSIYYGEDGYQIVEDYISDSYGLRDGALNSIMLHLDCEEFISEELYLYNSNYGYIDCF